MDHETFKKWSKNAQSFGISICNNEFTIKQSNALFNHALKYIQKN